VGLEKKRNVKQRPRGQGPRTEWRNKSWRKREKKFKAPTLHGKQKVADSSRVMVVCEDRQDLSKIRGGVFMDEE